MQDQPVIPSNEGHVPKQRARLARPIFAFLVPFCLFALMAWMGRSDDYEKGYWQRISDKEIIHAHAWEPTPEQNEDIALWCVLCGSTGGLMGLGVEQACTVAVKAIIRLKK